MKDRRLSHSKVVLAGDIGGTKSLLGLFYMTPRGPRLLCEETFSSKNYGELGEILTVFLTGKRRIAAACFGAPGPVIKGRVRTTNLPWLIDIGSLQKCLSIRKVEVINDLVANAYGVFALKKRDFKTLNKGEKGKGNAAILSAGTGLGEAILIWDGTGYRPSPSEGGHVDFASKNRLETELLQFLSKRFGHVSYERILSGEGLFHLYQFLKAKGLGSEPEWLSQRMEREDPASVISKVARQKKNRLCAETLELFISIYGSAAGNLALQVMAIGGIYIGGGIAPKIIWKLKDGTFMKAFIDKGRFSRMLAKVPVKVIMNDRAALLGAAAHAFDLLKRS